MRSVVTHKSPPDYYVGKSVLHGKILRKNLTSSSLLVELLLDELEETVAGSFQED